MPIAIASTCLPPDSVNLTRAQRGERFRKIHEERAETRSPSAAETGYLPRHLPAVSTVAQLEACFEIGQSHSAVLHNLAYKAQMLTAMMSARLCE